MAANFQFFARMHTDYTSAAPIWQAPERAADLAEEHVDRDAHWSTAQVVRKMLTPAISAPC